MTVQPVRNCYVGEVLRHPDGRVMAAELLFGQPLQAAQTWVLECELHDPTATGRTEFAHAFRRLEGSCLLEVRFDAVALPRCVYGYVRADLYTEAHRLTDLPLNNHHAVHLAAEDMTAGVLGISWEWPSA